MYSVRDVIPEPGGSQSDIFRRNCLNRFLIFGRDLGPLVFVNHFRYEVPHSAFNAPYQVAIKNRRKLSPGRDDVIKELKEPHGRRRAVRE